MKVVDEVLMANEGATLSPEVPTALVDTGCTRCMHGVQWRERFEKACLKPRSLEVRSTGQRRSFSSAFGGRQDGRVIVIPVGLGGRTGFVYSTEMDNCDTPLLLSLASQESLGAVIHLQEMRMELRALGVEVPLFKIGGHLAARVDDWGAEITTADPTSEPTTASSNHDSKFYLVQAPRELDCSSGLSGRQRRAEVHCDKEAAEESQAYVSEDRGVRPGDATGILAK